jgi:hypothetical protein
MLSLTKSAMAAVFAVWLGIRWVGGLAEAGRGASSKLDVKSLEMGLWMGY